MGCQSALCAASSSFSGTIASLSRTTGILAIMFKSAHNSFALADRFENLRRQQVSVCGSFRPAHGVLRCGVLPTCGISSTSLVSSWGPLVLWLVADARQFVKLLYRLLSLSSSVRAYAGCLPRRGNGAPFNIIRMGDAGRFVIRVIM